jgi:hypothetical protein
VIVVNIQEHFPSVGIGQYSTSMQFKVSHVNCASFLLPVVCHKSNTPSGSPLISSNYKTTDIPVEILYIIQIFHVIVVNIQEHFHVLYCPTPTEIPTHELYCPVTITGLNQTTKVKTLATYI